MSTDAERNVEDEDDLVHDYGITSYQRRLADKILISFNHAYAIDEKDVADLLLRALDTLVRHETVRRNTNLLSKAELWKQFVAARDQYQAARDAHAQGSPERDAALLRMKDAYQVWNEA